MPRHPIILALALIVLATGCASKTDLEAAQTELAACREETVRLEGSVVAWEERFDRESSRWVELEASVSEALPRALNEFHTERERIIELVPEQVQGEIEAYLEDYFKAVAKGFSVLSEDNAAIKTQLQATHKALQAVGADTRAIGITIDRTVAEERAKREGEQARRERVTAQLAKLVDQVVEFDQSRINCKECPERLKLNRNQRETVLGFHAELMADLAEVQTFADDVLMVEPVDAPELPDS